MIKSSLKIIFTIFIIISLFGANNYTFGASSQKSQYLSLHPLSSSPDVKKFQKFFKALKIYKGNIDGEYSSIKPDIIKFQIENKIIKSEKENGAGYIGPKTYKFFEDKFGDKFKRVYDKYFKLEEIKSGINKCFIVSAYYSPLRGQRKYSTRTYAGDIRLNGNGTHGASGVAVHPGFIAAPSAYPFGTKIELESLGIGIVEDRGGAIVKAGVRGHECDRLDIWMGYGDEGLNRALKWGKKKVSGKILDKNTKITINFSTIHKEYLAKKISPESIEKDIKYMQDLFKKAKIYYGKIDGKYGTFKESIVDFQVKNKVIKDKNDYAAGYIGNKTILKLEEMYPDIFIIVRRKDVKNKKIVKFDQKNTQNKTGTVPVKINISKNKNIVTTKDKATEEILQKYKITLKTKQQVDVFNQKINSYFDKKIGDNKLKIKTAKNQLKKKLDKIIKKTKNIKTKSKLTYLKNIIK